MKGYGGETNPYRRDHNSPINAIHGKEPWRWWHNGVLGGGQIAWGGFMFVAGVFGAMESGGTSLLASLKGIDNFQAGLRLWDGDNSATTFTY